MLDNLLTGRSRQNVTSGLNPSDSRATHGRVLNQTSSVRIVTAAITTPAETRNDSRHRQPDEMALRGSEW